jgi:NAD(P)H dehydrogenase (quinone)
MTLGITGASGQLGTRVLHHLLTHVVPAGVVAISRTPSKVDRTGRPHLQLRSGDFNDRDSLTNAFAGIDRLLMIPASELLPGVRPRQHQNAIDAAVAAGVSHVIYVSSIGARPGPRDGILETHFFTEQALIASGLAWTFIRMNIYTDFQIDGVKRAIASGEYAAPDGAPYAYVVRDDLAALAAAILETTGHEGVTYHATGPESVTHEQIAADVSKALGKPIRYVPRTPVQSEDDLVAAGVSPPIVDVLMRSQRAGRAGAFDLVTGDIERISGRRPQSPIEFIVRAVQR